MSKIVISKQAYLHNLTQISNRAGSKDKVIIVLKDNAYGHGALDMARLASEFGIKFACVRTQDEATEISDFFQNIIILSHIPTGDEDSRFIYAINDISGLNLIKKGVKIHLGIDTLMHRNGLQTSQIKDAFNIANNRNLNICGAFTHFRSSDEPTGEYFIQKENFLIAKNIIKKLCNNQKEFIFHSHNSAATERAINFDNELIRVGISQYGYFQFNDSLNLKPILTLFANKVSQRILKTGQSIGYGGTFRAKADMRVATYDLGYADGLLRYNGKGDLFLGSKVKMLGKMSMDNFSCEDVGDEVCVFNDARIWAEFFDTISYEILVKLSPKIKRIYI